MFLTAQSLAIEYGIDDRIAKFFVDREPPKDNLYWKNKLLYLRPQPGYIFIPLIVDLYFRCGLSLKTLLGDEFVGIIEQILHLAAREESGEISQEVLNNYCGELVRDRATDPIFFQELADYFYRGAGVISAASVPYKALRRGDVFLYCLCLLEESHSKLLELAEIWFALISTLLLLDDSEDYLSDLDSADENVFIESGSSKEGFEKIKAMLTENLAHLEKINYSLAHSLHRKVISIPEKPGIREYLNA